mgnify:CR=1 FL=1
MKIYRNGQEIELTKEELQAAYDEYDTQTKRRELAEKLESMEIELPADCFDDILDMIDNDLADNDSYWCIYDFLLDIMFLTFVPILCVHVSLWTYIFMIDVYLETYTHENSYIFIGIPIR